MGKASSIDPWLVHHTETQVSSEAGGGR